VAHQWGEAVAHQEGAQIPLERSVLKLKLTWLHMYVDMYGHGSICM